METIIVTGSSGFIGSALASRLSKNYHVVGLDVDVPRARLPGVDYFSVNLASPGDIEKVLVSLKDKGTHKIASVVHLAAYYNFDGKPSPKYQEITVNGTANLLKNLRKHFELEQFIFSSSMLVHTPADTNKEIFEDSPVRESWGYPNSKIAAEKVIHEERGDVSVLVLRIAGVYRDDCRSLPLSQQIARIYECQLTSAFLPGNADNGQTLIHLEDLIDVIEIGIGKRTQLPDETTLLIGEDQIVPYRKLQAIIGRLTHNISWPTIRIPKFVARTGATVLEKLPLVRDPFIKPWMIDYADDNYDLNIDRARNLLNWEPKRKLEEKLPMMIEGLKKDPVAWYKVHKIEVPKFRAIKPLDESEQRQYWAAAIFNIFLAIWLMSNPFTLGPMGVNEFQSDLISGFLVIVFSALSLLPALRWFRWFSAGVGAWLMFAPLIFWSKSAAAYSNQTLIGGLILLFGGFTTSAKDINEIPQGWSYNPSKWTQRLPIMTLALIGFLLSRHLAAFQMGHITSVWEPFFGDGSVKILRSDVSRAFPVSDAGLGALSYLLDVIAAAIGGRNRWRAMPWMVMVFGLLIVPTGVVSIVLVMLQPIAVGAWCTVCLITAALMLMMVPATVDEVVATVQFLRRSVKEGRPFWQTFWIGGEDFNVEEKPVMAEREARGSRANVYLSVLLGTALLFLPDLMSMEKGLSNLIYIVGALSVTFSVIATADVARISRLINVPLGLVLAIVPWVLEADPIVRLIVSLLGVVLLMLSLPRGKVTQHFGSFDPWVYFNLLQLKQWLVSKRHVQH